MPNNNRPFAPFGEYLRALKAATHQQAQAYPGSKVANADSFDEMRQHLLDLYDGVDVVHSFMSDSGQVFDCIPMEQQLALRRAGPDAQLAPLPGPRISTPRTSAPSPVRPARNDRFGNAMASPPGTIATRRIELAEITRHETLHHFFGKHRGRRGQHPPLPRANPDDSTPGATHKYAYAHQVIDNMGGHSTMSVARPAATKDQMSLSQHWYTGGDGTHHQTVEVGWQVQSALYNDLQPHIFVYWTADNYGMTGSYNMEGGHFVQTNSNFVFGEAMTDGTVDVEAYIMNANWYIFIGGELLGYFPIALYDGGALATKASNFKLGGETAGANNVWPPMGTGSFPGPTAASHTACYYFPLIDSTTQIGPSTPPDLQLTQTDSTLYQIAADGPDAFTFGGTGGSPPG